MALNKYNGGGNIHAKPVYVNRQTNYGAAGNNN